MKLFLLLTVSVILSVHATLYSQNKPIKYRAILDSLHKNEVSPAELRAKSHKANLNSVISPFNERTIILANGSTASFRTSDNEKVEKALSQLFSKSPLDFLMEVKGIEGRILINTSALNWIKPDDIPDLINLVNIDVVTPEICQEQPPDAPVASGFHQRYALRPMGVNALMFINCYLCGIFPAVIPSYQSVITWYDSKKGKEYYRYEPYTPVMGAGPLPLLQKVH